MVIPMSSFTIATRFSATIIACLACMATAHLANAQSDPEQEKPKETAPVREFHMPDIVVLGRDDSLVGVADSASQAAVGREQLDRRPIHRPGEIGETVPGLIITQHSGSGKANQFFLRGFNLDHGTDFATFLGGVPIN